MFDIFTYLLLRRLMAGASPSSKVTGLLAIDPYALDTLIPLCLSEVDAKTGGT